MSWLLRFRYLAVVIVALLLAHSVALLALAGVRAYQAYRLILQGTHWIGGDRPGIHIVESVDAMLLSLVLFVLATGVVSLFVTPGDKATDPRVPPWLRFRNLFELKHTLWEAVLVTMVVASVTSFIANLDQLTWNELILPAGILILSVSLAVVRRFGHSPAEE